MTAITCRFLKLESDLIFPKDIVLFNKRLYKESMKPIQMFRIIYQYK